MLKRILILSIFSLFLFQFQKILAQNAFQNLYTADTLTVYDLFYLQNNISTQKDLLSKLNKKILFFQQQYRQTSNTLDLLKLKLKLYKKTYAELLKTLFFIKLNSYSVNVFILSSCTLNQANQRYNFLKLLLNFTKNITNYIKLLNQQYASNLSALKTYKQTLEYYLNNYQNNKTQLDSNINYLLQKANSLKQNSSKIRITINQNYKSFEAIENQILNSSKVQTNGNISNFGNILSPLANPIIISSFGVHSHPYLKNVQIKNDGVDLYSRDDTLVKAAESGVVVAVLSIPHNGKSVVLKHSNDYFTVYSNLNLVYLTEKDTVIKSQLVGSISKITSKYSFPCLNFQVWYKTNKLNPTDFLKL